MNPIYKLSQSYYKEEISFEEFRKKRVRLINEILVGDLTEEISIRPLPPQNFADITQKLPANYVLHAIENEKKNASLLPSISTIRRFFSSLIKR